MGIRPRLGAARDEGQTGVGGQVQGLEVQVEAAHNGVLECLTPVRCRCTLCAAHGSPLPMRLAMRLDLMRRGPIYKTGGVFMSIGTRPAAVAGMFYPGDARTLARDVDHLLGAAAPGTVPIAATRD